MTWSASEALSKIIAQTLCPGVCDSAWRISLDYDVVVLDRGIPLVHGDEVCRSLIAERRETRILLLTAASAVADRVAGLELVPDDYLPKPSAFTELVARVRSLGRQSRPGVPPLLQRAGIALDPARHRVTRHDRPISLTKKNSLSAKNRLARMVRSFRPRNR
ncbi:response regulator transcription factor [Saccharopolyspora pogona]|uniref:response regulator transcription factor n=1 Tax=Saccharopolyspora pogona TaxID=333966 RepID=UPI001CC22826